MDCVAIIPARYGSTRFPGKPLATLLDRPLIQHVVERCAAVEGIAKVIVATDDERIVDAVEDTAAEAVLTTVAFASGTDRVAHVAADLGAEIVVNVQGDEPLLDADELGAALRAFRESGVDFGTLRAPLRAAEDLWDPNTVKVVVDGEGTALYFSRAPLPFPRAQYCRPAASTRQDDTGTAGRGRLEFEDAPDFPGPYWIHVGVYLYRTPALLRWARMPRSPLEIAESLEQLRVLEAGERMHTYAVSESLPGVDTPEDLDRVRLALGDNSMDDNKP